MERSIGEVDDEQAATLVQELHEGTLARRTETVRILPIDVVLHDHLIVGQVFLRQLFYVGGDVHPDAWVAFQRRFEDRRCLLPVVPLVSLIAGEEQHVDRRLRGFLLAAQRRRDLVVRVEPGLHAILRHL